MVVVMACYRPGINVEYYLNHHVPRSEELMVPLGLERAEVRRFFPGPDGQDPLYAVISTLYFPSMEVFQATMSSPVMAELMADVKNFYGGEPETFVGEELRSRNYRA